MALGSLVPSQVDLDYYVEVAALVHFQVWRVPLDLLLTLFLPLEAV